MFSFGRSPTRRGGGCSTACSRWTACRSRGSRAPCPRCRGSASWSTCGCPRGRGGAGLVTSPRGGRERHHYLNAVPIRELHDRWLDRYRARAASVLLELKTTLEEGDMSKNGTSRVFTVYVRTTPDQAWQAITDPQFTSPY